MPKYIRYYTSKSCKDGTLLTVSVAERNLRRQEKDNIAPTAASPRLVDREKIATPQVADLRQRGE